MNSDEVLVWVHLYERAWRDGDLTAIEALFTEDACYRVSPYAADKVGHGEIRDMWLADEDGDVFTMSAEPVAVDGSVAVVRVEVRYGDPLRQEYRDLWVLRFADDGRVSDFEEWAYWPDKPHVASP